MSLRAFAFYFGIIAALAAIYLFLEWESMGFPDGHLTDFQKAMQIPYLIGFIGCACFSISFFYFLLHSSEIERRTFLTIAVLFFFLLIMIGFLAYYYRVIQGLENGEGG